LSRAMKSGTGATPKQALTAKVFSRVEFTPAVAREQLLWLADFNGGNFAPERCDVYEPFRLPFDRDNLDVPVGWLSQPGGEFKCKRARYVKWKGVLTNRRFQLVRIREGPREHWRPFCAHCS